MAIWNNEAERGQSLSVESQKEKGNSSKRQYDYDRIISHISSQLMPKAKSFLLFLIAK